MEEGEKRHKDGSMTRSRGEIFEKEALITASQKERRFFL